ncbi:MAG TPA: PilZ domain-containing protein [Bacillus bacterium]|nr:PilZ domain-containing protein [Bacillus sp. (in: firmicutes)]
MIFRRNESFRYTFKSPLECQYKIIKIEGLSLCSDFGSGQIIDISPGGMKLMTPLNLWNSNKKVEIEIHFSLDNHPFQISGHLRWQKEAYQNGHYFYGVLFDHSAEISSKITELLKSHVRRMLQTERKDHLHEDKFIMYSKRK